MTYMQNRKQLQAGTSSVTQKCKKRDESGILGGGKESRLETTLRAVCMQLEKREGVDHDQTKQ